jgi:hypothetical protein
VAATLHPAFLKTPSAVETYRSRRSGFRVGHRFKVAEDNARQGALDVGKQPMLEPACLAFDVATNTACFETYDGECLMPALRPGDIVVIDNLSCHKTLRDNLSCHETAEVVRLINSAGAEVRYLPHTALTSTRFTLRACLTAQ